MSEETELKVRQRIMGEINDLLYNAQGKPGTRVFNQTSIVDDVKALIQERDRLRAALDEIIHLPQDDFKTAWSIAVAARRAPEGK